MLGARAAQEPSESSEPPGGGGGDGDALVPPPGGGGGGGGRCSCGGCVKYADIGVNMGGGAFALETGAGGGGVDKYVGTEDTENDEPPPLGVEPIGFPDGPFGTGTSVNTPFGTSGASTKCTTGKKA